MQNNARALIPAAGPVHMSRNNPNTTPNTIPLKSSKKNENTIVNTRIR